MSPQEHIFCLHSPSSPWRNFQINLLDLATRYPVTEVALGLCDIPHKNKNDECRL